MRRPRDLAAAALVTALLASGSPLAQVPEQADDLKGCYGPLPLRPKDVVLVEKSPELHDLFARRGYLVESGPEAELVARVGATVAPTPTDEYITYRFSVVRSEIPNAFALADGSIYVNTGLLALLENEAQLASVLAHEVMHAEGHHPIVHARQARKKQGGMVALQVLLPYEIGSLVNIALVHAIIGYGRDLEEEADRRAIERILDAGYDPREMPKVFELLDQDPEGTQLPVKATWSSHPLAVQRAKYTREILAAMAPRIAEAEQRRGGLRVGREDFDASVAWAARDSVELHIDADRPRMALAYAQNVVERWPDDPDAHYLLGESHRALDAREPVFGESDLTKKAKRERLRTYGRYTRDERARMRRDDPTRAAWLEQNWKKAEAAYRDALRLDPTHADSMRGMGALNEDKGELREAGRWYADYLKAAPVAIDRPVVLKHLADITAELKSARADEATGGQVQR